ncbi:GNAT family N-acetyltransferase [Proteiniborus sp. MB09-C3]|uniref:GNAT family N-acetyltransferase n=1 Tax=Proteiniborus sp. MB09-C3 TaxID=3050072 RepID=UPI0025525865|nr:GNAT family N-acetyltransferase [Proteiniborus sp. MB09-C3]WIV13829.1 GNAT family N-acetyltransferase [Proteiniborus sp. MB09-C3]
MNSKGSDEEDGSNNNCDSEAHNNKSILRLSHYKKEIIINIADVNGEIGYIKGVLLNVDNIFNELKSDEILKILEFTDKEEEEEIKSFYIQVLSKENCKDNAFYITELFIEKEYRGNGIGRRIFEQLPRFLDRNICEPVSCIYLMPGPLEKINGEVEYIMNPKDENMVLLKQRLIRFYESVGFKRIGETDFYYKKEAS